MKYDFDKLTDRFNQNSLKWDVQKNELPMWVADMDFEVAPEIVNALQERLDKKVFGYNIIPNEWNKAYVNHWKNKHGYEMKEDELLFSTGVVPTISSLVRKLTTPGENVLIQTPVYNIFFNSIVNNGRNVLESPLIYKDGKYEINYTDLEEKLSLGQTTMMILCNPHNPIGKIWSKDELAKIGCLCHKYNVIVLSDEIHCDITDPDKNYISFQSVNEECRNISVMAMAPTKCFNIAGLQTSAICVPNKFLRHKVWRAINTDEIAEPNTFAIQAVIAAFNNGEEWLSEMRQYVYENKQIVSKYLKDNIKEVYLVPSEATYLLWIDCSKITENTLDLCDFIRKETGLYVSDGVQYGKTGANFIRLNIACPKERLLDGLNRFKIGIEKYIELKKN